MEQDNQGVGSERRQGLDLLSVISISAPDKWLTLGMISINESMSVHADTCNTTKI